MRKRKEIQILLRKIGARMKNFKKIACIIGVIILVGLYLLSLISAIFYKQGFQKIFNAAIYSTFIIPVLLYAMMLIYKVLSKKED